MSQHLFENYDAPAVEIANTEQYPNTDWDAVTFTVGATSHTVTSVKLLLLRVGTLATHTVTVSIRAVSANKPTGADLASVTYDPVALSTVTPTLIEFTFASPPTVSANTQYAIVWRMSSGTTDVSNHINGYGIGNPGSGVANEKLVDSADSGATWSILGSTPEYYVYGNFLFTGSDSISLSESLVIASPATINVTETIGFSETRLAHLNSIKQSTLALSETLATLFRRVLSLSETILLSETLSVVKTGWDYVARNSSSYSNPNRNNSSWNNANRNNSNWTFKNKS